MGFHGKDIRIFTGNSNRLLATRIGEILGLPLGKAEVSRFSDGETSVSINESVRGSDVFIVQSLSTPANDRLMELLLLLDACKRASAARITAVIPYMGYARQDRKVHPRDPISAKLVADMLTLAGADRVLTMDLHSPQIQGFFDIPVDHLLGAPVLAEYFRRKIREDTTPGEYVVVAPALGSVAEARDFAARLDCPLAMVDKRSRQGDSFEVMNLIGDVRGKKAILLDDLIDTAGTLIYAAEALLAQGGAQSVTAAATHGVLSGPAVERIRESRLDEVVLLDTIHLPPEKGLHRFRVLSAAPAFAEAIRRIYEDLPLSMSYR